MQTTIPPIAAATERQYLSLDEAAETIGSTRRFLETRIVDGELKVFRPSKRFVRIKRTEFERWVEEYSTKSGAKSAKIGKVPASAPSTPTADQRVEA